MAECDMRRLSLSLMHFLWIASLFAANGIMYNSLQLLFYLVLWPFSKRLYRIVLTQTMYLAYSTMFFGATWWANMQIYCYGNKEDFLKIGKESAVVIMNHRGGLDWMTGLLFVDHVNMIGNVRCVAKDIIKYIPAFGWSCWFNEYCLIKRNWEAAKKQVQEHYQELNSYPVRYWLTSFPEGTRATPQKLKESQEYAKSIGVQALKHHLQPRTKGFVSSVKSLKESAGAVYDVTIVVDNEKEHSFQTLAERKRAAAHVCFRRYPMDSIPSDIEEEIASWCRDVFCSKDKLLDHYFNNNITFPGKPFKIKRKWRCLMCFTVQSLLSIAVICYGISHMSATVAWAIFSVILLAVIVGLSIIRYASSSSNYGAKASRSPLRAQGISQGNVVTN